MFANKQEIYMQTVYWSHPKKVSFTPFRLAYERGRGTRGNWVDEPLQTYRRYCLSDNEWNFWTVGMNLQMKLNIGHYNKNICCCLLLVRPTPQVFL